jgi:asparagine synthase (glutamine-hydrolysing)
LFREPERRHHAFAAWVLLFYALWHRCHIEALPPAPDVFATLGMRA